jgi:type III pantothenate kinase
VITLLVDIGNTRVKWTSLREAGAQVREGHMHALAHGGDAAAAMRRVAHVAPRGTGRVLAVNVGGARLARALDAAVRARFGCTTEYVSSERARFGVRNGYREVWRLGADRWVGVIGARDLVPRKPLLVASAGTALTVDAVSAAGRHFGGAIVPAPDTMIASLLGGTDGIARRARRESAGRATGPGTPARAPARKPARTLFAADTARGLAAGAAFAAAAFIDRAVEEATAELGARPVVLLTGGAAPTLAPHIKSAVRLVPDLVLRGLAVFARG